MQYAKVSAPLLLFGLSSRYPFWGPLMLFLQPILDTFQYFDYNVRDILSQI